MSMLGWLNFNRPDVVWLEGPLQDGSYNWDESLPNQQEIVSLISSYDPNWENPDLPVEPDTIQTKKTFYPQFIKIDKTDSSEYLFSWTQHRTNLNVQSGDDLNGFRFKDSSPILMPFSGKVKSITVRCRGVATSERSATNPCKLNLELSDQLIDGKVTSISDIAVDIDTSVNKIGFWRNSSLESDINISNSLDIPVTKGQMLALKFISKTGESNIASVYNIAVSLEIEEDV